MEQDYRRERWTGDGLHDRMERIERDIELIAGSLRLVGRGETSAPTIDTSADRYNGANAPQIPSSSAMGLDAYGSHQDRQRKAKTARSIIAERRRRERALGSELFADPAWDMLLDLYAAHHERRQVSISSLCIAAAVPATTALRWIRMMTDKGILCRAADEHDGRRIHVHLEDRVIRIMDQILAPHEGDGGRMPL